MHWCRQLFCPSKVLGFSDGPDLAQTPSLQHAGGVARGAPCAPHRGLRDGIGGPVHTSPWDGMGWDGGPMHSSPWDGMGGPVHTSPGQPLLPYPQPLSSCSPSNRTPSHSFRDHVHVADSLLFCILSSESLLISHRMHPQSIST